MESRDVRELEREVFNLRKFGFDNEEIVLQINREDVGIDEVERYFQNALRRSQQMQLTIQDHRALEIQRYEFYLQALNRRIGRGDTKAVNAAIRLSAEKSRLLGLYTPIESKVNVLVEERVNDEIDRFLRLLASDERMSPEIMNLIREIAIKFHDNQLE